MLLHEDYQDEQPTQDRSNQDDDQEDGGHHITIQCQDMGIQGGDEETIEELLQKAHEAGRESRYAKTRTSYSRKV